MRTRAFTLIELMVVLAIIGVLTGLLLPVLNRTRETGRSAACLSNLHQIGIGLQIYVQENQNNLPVLYDKTTNGMPPIGKTMDVVLAPFIGSSNVFRCPSDNRNLYQLTGTSYSWNV